MFGPSDNSMVIFELEETVNCVENALLKTKYVVGISSRKINLAHNAIRSQQEINLNPHSSSRLDCS
jgi:hypothetical protein